MRLLEYDDSRIESNQTKWLVLAMLVKTVNILFFKQDRRLFT